jgi:hypothetical protein
MELHSNAGAHLRDEINLLPDHLVPSSNFDPKGNNAADQSLQLLQNFVPNADNSGENCEPMQVSEAIIPSAEHEDDPAPKSAAIAAIPEESTSGSGATPTPGGSRQESKGDVQDSRETPLDLGHMHVLPGESTPARGTPSGSGHMPSGRSSPGSAPQSLCGQGELLGSSTPGTISTALDRGPARPRTRLQDGIRKEKKITDGTIRYDYSATTNEPRDLSDALMDKNWKAAMDDEFNALMKNKTWHLVPPDKVKNVIDCK